ncbi:hypothetical protein [Ulvibacterium sp.]|uniref:hypothetical protein n=1 Tax=Ulvibacterium sp. TaxID=2665914 RepID=UPI003BAB8329
MPKEKLVTIKEADITNNCPECFSQDMKIAFFQKHTYGRLIHRTTNEITHQITCKKCNSIIYPVDWTDDIEKIFDYYQKTAIPHKASIRFTSLFYVLLLVLVVLVGAGIYLFMEGGLTF